MGGEINSEEEFPEVARILSRNRSVSVLLKAGHLKSDKLTDIFYNAETDEIVELTSRRIHTKNTHGTGCTFPSAIAAYLAHGLPLNDAIKHAKDYINSAIAVGAEYEIGKGHGPVHYFFQWWE